MPIKLFSASAGAGKTYRLATEYIAMAIHKEDRYGYFRKILAVTFTNKAAQEMRERILKFLFEIYSNQNTPLIQSIQEILKEYQIEISEEEIKRRAQFTHQYILQDYGLFSVMTIDSFVQKLSGSFWNELNLPSNYEIELDVNNIIDQVLNSVLLKIQIPENDYLKKIFLELVQETIDDEKSWFGIRENIKQFLKNLFNEDFQEIEDKFSELIVEDFLFLKNKLRKFIKEIDETYYSLNQNITDKIIQFNLNDVDLWNYKSNGTISHLFKIRQKIKFFSDKISYTDKGSINPFKGPENSHHQEIIDDIYQLIEYRNSQIVHYLFAQEILKEMSNMAILSYFKEELNHFQSTKGIIPISEFSKKMYATIAQDPVPFIFEKLGARYEHILIDEFQDTSLLQWKNFMPLLENSSDGVNHNLLVGDAKQAIYSFRGGDVQIFDHLRKTERNYLFNLSEFDADRLTIIRSRTETFPLNKNYRSNPSIINFNNSFYEFCISQASEFGELFQDIYTNNIAQISPKNEVVLNSDIEIQFFQQSKETKVADRNRAHQLAVVKKIKELRSEGIPYSSMAILCRKNKQLDKIIEELLQQKIPVKSSDSLFIDFSPLYQFLLSLLKYKVNPGSKFHSFACLHYFSILFNKPEINPNENLIEFFDNQGFDIQRIFDQNFGLAETVQKIIHSFNLFSFKYHSDYLYKFLDIVDEYLLRNSDMISDFTEFLDENSKKFSINSSGETNAITVTSYHKAKGLEFPIVFLPFLKDDFFPEKNLPVYKWMDLEPILNNDLTTIRPDKNLKAAKFKLNFFKENNLIYPEFTGFYHQETNKIVLDSINAYYVATTRAEARMYLFSEIDIAEKPSPFKLENLLFNFVSNNPQFSLKSDHSSEFLIYKMTIPEEAIMPSKDPKKGTEQNFDFTFQLQEKPKLRIQHDKKELYNKNDRRKYLGNLIHELLANQTDKEFENELNWKEEEIFEDFISQIEKLKRDAEYGFLLDNKYLVFSEKDIIVAEDRIFRPDRFIQYQNQYYVIDFKTGKPSPDHLVQIKNYQTVLEEMGFKPIKSVLIYLKNGEIQIH